MTAAGCWLLAAGERPLAGDEWLVADAKGAPSGVSVRLDDRICPMGFDLLALLAGHILARFEGVRERPVSEGQLCGWLVVVAVDVGGQALVDVSVQVPERAHAGAVEGRPWPCDVQVPIGRVGQADGGRSWGVQVSWVDAEEGAHVVHHEGGALDEVDEVDDEELVAVDDGQPALDLFEVVASAQLVGGAVGFLPGWEG